MNSLPPYLPEFVHIVHELEYVKKLVLKEANKQLLKALLAVDVQEELVTDILRVEGMV